MADTFELTLNNPLTEEQWDMIADVDFDRTDRIWFHTKHGKEVEFTKVIRCKDCTNHEPEDYCHIRDGLWYDNDYCSSAERKQNDSHEREDQKGKQNA